MQISMTKLLSKFAILLLNGIARLPFGVLYFFSDCLYLLVYTVFGYRKKVVRLNLANSFPNKNAQELLEIERDFYRNLCDTIIETIKSTHITQKEIKERVSLVNEAYVADLYAKNKKIFAMQGHYANWEWPALAWCILYPGKSIGIYKPLTNPFFDQYYFDFRSRFGMQPIAMNEVARTLIAKRNEA
jgi:KDO2-lipid IV(A) lauroyltransferase